MCIEMLSGSAGTDGAGRRSWGGWRHRATHARPVSVARGLHCRFGRRGQFGQGNTQGARDCQHGFKRRRSAPELKQRNVCAVQAGIEGKRFLRVLALLAQFSQCLREGCVAGLQDRGPWMRAEIFRMTTIVVIRLLSEFSSCVKCPSEEKWLRIWSWGRLLNSRLTAKGKRT